MALSVETRSAPLHGTHNDTDARQYQRSEAPSIRRTRAAQVLDITRPESHRSPLADPLLIGISERAESVLLLARSAQRISPD